MLVPTEGCDSHQDQGTIVLQLDLFNNIRKFEGPYLSRGIYEARVAIATKIIWLSFVQFISNLLYLIEDGNLEGVSFARSVQSFHIYDDRLADESSLQIQTTNRH